MTKPPNDLELFRQKALYVLKIVIVSSVLIALTIIGKNVLLLSFAAILLAIFFHGLGGLVSHLTGWRQSLSLIVGIVGILVLFALLGIFSAPGIERQFEELSKQIPSSLQNVRDSIAEYPLGERVISRVSEGFSWQDIPIGGSGIVSKATGAAASVVNIVVNFFIILLAGIYLTIDPQAYRSNLESLFPPEKRKKVTETLRTVGNTLQWWLAGRLLSMAVIGVATTIGLMLIGVPLAFLLGVFAGLVSFIPNIGPIISAVPAVLLGFSQSPQLALYVILLYAAIQTVESYLLTPLIERKTVSIRPAFLLIVQLLFGIFFGILGLTLASPIVAAGIVLTKKLYIEPMEEKSS